MRTSLARTHVWAYQRRCDDHVLLLDQLVEVALGSAGEVRCLWAWTDDQRTQRGRSVQTRDHSPRISDSTSSGAGNADDIRSAVGG
jgi:hypothetical protein